MPRLVANRSTTSSRSGSPVRPTVGGTWGWGGTAVVGDVARSPDGGSDTVVWMSVPTTGKGVVGAVSSHRMEAWMFANYATYTVTRVSGSKDWAFTATGPWMDTTTLGAADPGRSGGMQDGAQHPRRARSAPDHAGPLLRRAPCEAWAPNRSGGVRPTARPGSALGRRMVRAAFEPVVLPDGDIRREVVSTRVR